jgi:phosphomannomutase
MRIRLVIFDLDDTLAVSKSPLAPEMAQALHDLLETRHVAVISGTKWELFRDLFVANIAPQYHSRLLIAPVSGAQIYRYRSAEWQLVNQSFLGVSFEAIVDAFTRAFAASGFVSPTETWGPQFEDRIAQVTYSALGQRAPADAKRAWDPDLAKRLPVIEQLRQLLPSYLSIRAGGGSSIDVSGFEKDYGIRQVLLQFIGDRIEESDALFIGDAIHPGGNDYAVTRTQVHYRSTRGLAHTRALIRRILDDEASVLAASGRGSTRPESPDPEVR